MLGTREAAIECVKTKDFSFQITIDIAPVALTQASMKDQTVKIPVSWVEANSYFGTNSTSVQFTNVNICSSEKGGYNQESGQCLRFIFPDLCGDAWDLMHCGIKCYI